MKKNFYFVIDFICVTIVFLLITISFSCKKQLEVGSKDVDFLFLENVIDSIREEYGHLAENTTANYLLEDSVLIFTDTFFKSEDKQFLYDQLNNEGSKNWDFEKINQTVVVKKETLDKLFAPSLEEGWMKFHQIYGKGFLMLSDPLFNAKCNLCILEINYFCGSKCGGGNVSLFKKTNGKWIFVKKYSEWVS